MTRNRTITLDPDLQSLAAAIDELKKSSSRRILDAHLEYLTSYFNDPNNASVPEQLRAAKENTSA